MVGEIDIWRAAQQIIKAYPDDPVMEAAQRADAAYEAGDIPKFDVWTRITRRINDLLKQKPCDGESLN